MATESKPKTANKRFGITSAKKLTEFIADHIGDDNPDDFDVFIDDRDQELVIVNVKTSMGDSIRCPKLMHASSKGGEDAN